MRKYNIPKSNAYLCPLIKNHLIPRKDKGFTLIELLIVIGIIGILSGMIMVNFSGTTDKARLAKAREFSQSILNAMGADLVADWTFDEGTGTSAKDSWGANHGTLKNFDFSASSGWKSASDCISGSCLQFDGVNDYVNCGNDTSLDITDAITIEAWVKINGFSGIGANHNEITMKAWNILRLFVDSTSHRLAFVQAINGNAKTINSATVFNTNKWYHVAATYDGSYLKLYVNGASDTTPVSASGSMATTSSNLLIGTYAASGAYGSFNGLIDEVRIYNVAIPTAQIQQHYVQGLEKLLANKAISPTEYSQRMAELGKLLADKQ